MMLKVVTYGNPILRKKVRLVSDITSEIRQLSDNMIDTMKHLEGIGLAAPQVGKSLAIFVIDWSLINGNDPEVVINPTIISKLNRTSESGEGCLSLPGVIYTVDRNDIVKVRYTDINGKVVLKTLSGLPARVFQHEYDHLLGRLIIDYD